MSRKFKNKERMDSGLGKTLSSAFLCVSALTVERSGPVLLVLLLLSLACLNAFSATCGGLPFSCNWQFFVELILWLLEASQMFYPGLWCPWKPWVVG